MCQINVRTYEQQSDIALEGGGGRGQEQQQKLHRSQAHHSQANQGQAQRNLEKQWYCRMQRVLAQHALRETNIENRCYPRHCLPSWEVPTHFQTSIWFKTHITKSKGIHYNHPFNAHLCCPDGSCYTVLKKAHGVLCLREKVLMNYWVSKKWLPDKCHDRGGGNLRAPKVHLSKGAPWIASTYTWSIKIWESKDCIMRSK